MFAVISRSSAEKKTEVAEAVALQRSQGVLDLIFSSRDGISYGERTFQQGAMKVRFPNVASGERPEAVVINTAGGLTGGDRLDLTLHVNTGAAVTVTSQACEKVYRSTDQAAVISVKLSLDTGAAMDWLPQPMIFFDGARLARETHVSIAPDASFLAVEGVMFGRAAMGETVQSGMLRDSWLIERAGRIMHVDKFDTGDDIGSVLGKKTVLDGHCAMATIRYVAPDAMARLEEMRALLAVSPFPAAASAWDGMMVVRIVAPENYGLVGELIRVLSAFRARAMPRVWSM